VGRGASAVVTGEKGMIEDEVLLKLCAVYQVDSRGGGGCCCGVGCGGVAGGVPAPPSIIVHDSAPAGVSFARASLSGIRTPASNHL
jgi:hypothetical protein